MNIHCTKKLLDKLQDAGKSVWELDECQEQTGGLFSWHCNLVSVGRFKAVICVNDLTKFVVVLFRPKARDYKGFEQLFCKALRVAGQQEGYTKEAIDAYFEQCGDIKFAKTAGRSLLGTVNRVCKDMSYMTGLLQMDYVIQEKIGLRLNRELYMLEDRQYYRAAEIMAMSLCQLLGQPREQWREIMPCRGYQLKVQLKLGDHQVWRRIVVPDKITFNSLAGTIEKVFDWKGYHVHDFELLEDEEDYESDVPSYYVDKKMVIYDGTDEEGPEYLDEEKYEIESDMELYLYEIFEDNRQCLFTYDFGDHWEHLITVEKVIDNIENRRPKLIDRCGKRPPEDVGGISGYEEYLSVIDDENCPEHDSMVRWAEGLKEENFTIEEINHKLWW